ncbi:hypothetical protein LTR53_000341 [Teratosphaeriaceae sp. CCFEE 6253]|nr:hypothetical protein LTR53_000341 [Teratosphaeriaceae sp. CCFEE 6253]
MPGNLVGIPASVISSWPPPNYEHPNPRRTWVIPFVGVLQAIMTLMVCTRLWLRARQQAGRLGLDDALLLPGFLVATVFTTLVIISVRDYGLDRHIWDVPPDWFVDTVLLAWRCEPHGHPSRITSSLHIAQASRGTIYHDGREQAASMGHADYPLPYSSDRFSGNVLQEFAFLVATCCTKISVLLFYRRLVQGTFSKRWRLATIGAILFTACYCISFSLALILNCRPTEAYWKSFSLAYTADYTCADTRNLNPLSGALSVFSDFYSVVLPMGMLRHFEAPKRQKMALNAVFSLGLLVVAAGCARTYYIYQLGVDYDITWVGFDLYVWSCLEVHLALICASAPALRVFFREYMSDPLSRALNSTRSLTGSARGTKRDSRQTDTGGSVTYASHARDSSTGSREYDDRKLIPHHPAKPSLCTVGETEVEPPSSPYLRARSPAPPPEPYPIKTPADFEAFALQNLAKNRPPAPQHSGPAPTFLRPASASSAAGDMHPALERPFTDWYSPPKTRG